jgi:hypothetical protein
VDKAKADLDAAQATQAQSCGERRSMRRCAPISGIVAARLTELGEMAAPGKPLLTIYDPNGLRVTASIPQYQLAQMRSVDRRASSFPNWQVGRRQQCHRAADRRRGDACLTGTRRPTCRPELPMSFPACMRGCTSSSAAPSKLTVPQAAVVRRGEVAAVYVQNRGGGAVLAPAAPRRSGGGRRGRSAGRAAGWRACRSRPGESGHPDQVARRRASRRWVFPAASPASSPARK